MKMPVCVSVGNVNVYGALEVVPMAFQNVSNYNIITLQRAKHIC